jgi:hypothetical protein
MLLNVKLICSVGLVFLLLFATFIKASLVQCSRKSEEVRKSARESLNIPDLGIFFIVGYSILKEKGTFGVKKVPTHHDRSKVMTMTFEEIGKMLVFFDSSNYNFIYFYTEAAVAESFSSKSECSDPQMKFFIAKSSQRLNKNGGIAVVHACKLKKVANESKI